MACCPMSMKKPGRTPDINYRWHKTMPSRIERRLSDKSHVITPLLAERKDKFLEVESRSLEDAKRVRDGLEQLRARRKVRYKGR